MDSKGVQEQSLDLLVRTKTGIYLVDVNSESMDKAKRLSSDGAITNIAMFSQDGRIVLILEKQKVFTIELEADKVVAQMLGTNFQNVAITQNYVQVLDKRQPDSYQLSILKFPTLEVVHSFVSDEVSQREVKRYKKDLWPLVKFTTDEKYHTYIENGEIKVVETQSNEVCNPSITQLVVSLNARQCDNLTIQPRNSTNFLIIAYQLQAELSTKNNSGQLLIYDFSRPQKIIFEKPVPDASEIVVEWSPDGKSFLFIKSTTSDTSGQSYFGQSQVFLFDWKKYDFISIPTYEGPIHNVKWSADSQFFTVISGFMPSATVLFTKEGKPQFEFGKDHRNQIHWSPLQRFILICGFGNLDGSISVWDTLQLKNVGTCKSKAASQCFWLPCGRRFITARVTPRLNVDNAYTVPLIYASQVYDYQGCQLRTVPFEDLSLFEVLARPASGFKDRPPSPSRRPAEPVAQTQKKVFIPPGGSGLLAQQLRAQKQSEGARVLSQNETFGNQQQASWGLQRSTPAPKDNFPPGFVPPEKKEKKKRIRNKKNDDDG